MGDDGRDLGRRLAGAEDRLAEPEALVPPDIEEEVVFGHARSRRKALPVL